MPPTVSDIPDWLQTQLDKLFRTPRPQDDPNYLFGRDAPLSKNVEDRRASGPEYGETPQPITSVISSVLRNNYPINGATNIPPNPLLDSINEYVQRKSPPRTMLEDTLNATNR